MTYVVNKAKINGFINQKATCLANLETIAKHAQSFLSWDPRQGTWVIITNKSSPGTPTRIFDDNNIVGSINISSDGINNVFNSATATYSDERLRGKNAQTRVFIETEDRLANELDN